MNKSSLRVLNVVYQWIRQQQAVRQLTAMPDNLLLDIGVQRHEIPTVVKGLLNR